jgi:hypothetical protein
MGKKSLFQVYFFRLADIAQGLERRSVDPEVVGSRPIIRPILLTRDSSVSREFHLLTARVPCV